ncbi:hypothetical protein I4I73_23900 [Pseudonocardia sp. KRD-184]|uniref:PRC-barrel domain protein n=1 Tax=Pseudonocardia oceani TaxID=2792013 RepID=A0ABS6UD32_9PSEU|nr:hypothetical protein [Pseudonocardia oceani]MBW0091974.1 hypothetical protein [Pseudonocardia oceani]MBW0099040.1 hypothetical protein [Pseudonocardia oceani]MBW0111533.1 hypothetical protein [Pseudonocardia oceani]MBW0124180.1 hypothetical protein [Pseudonocardia oceani]MBW0130155.1 hypothetical protein [Pseudonocardia oceani]
MDDDVAPDDLITWPDGSTDRAGDLVGRAVVDRHGTILGRLDGLHPARERPRWGVVVAVFGRRAVPLAGLTRHGRGVQVTVDAQQVQAAPVTDPESLDLPEFGDGEQRLVRHYGGRAGEAVP